MSPDEHRAMIAHRARRTTTQADPGGILTTVQPADRIPSHGTQTSMDGTGELTHGPLDTLRVCDTHGLVPIGHLCMSIPRRVEPLNLWDTSADSIPETWSI